jgi:hypothetical protein
VGIGTSSPGATLDAVSRDLNAQALRVRGRASDNIGGILYTDNDGTTQRGFIQSRGDNEMRYYAGTGGANGINTFYTANLERMRIDSAGNVGIGLTNPTHVLEVQSGTSTNLLNLRANASATGGNAAGLSITAEPDLIKINTSTGGDSIAFTNQGTERLRITAAGNVGIGTTTPGSALQVQGLITGTAVVQNATDLTAGRLLSNNVGAIHVLRAAVTADYNSLDTFIGHLGVSSTNLPASTGLYLKTTSGAVNINYLNIQGSNIVANGNTLYHRANVLGTVSQSGGVPTGAIIERGSNANGEFVRYADGTMICFKDVVSLTFSSSAATTYGGVSGFRTSNGNAATRFTLPSSYVGNFSIVITSESTSGLKIIGGGRTNNNTAYVSAFSTSSWTNEVVSFNYVVVGRWY